MRQKASPAMILLAAVIMCAVVAGIYWKVMGPGSINPQEAKWNKPPSTGQIKIPAVPPPPSKP